MTCIYSMASLVTAKLQTADLNWGHWYQCSGIEGVGITCLFLLLQAIWMNSQWYVKIMCFWEFGVKIILRPHMLPTLRTGFWKIKTKWPIVSALLNGTLIASGNMKETVVSPPLYFV